MTKELFFQATGKFLLGLLLTALFLFLPAGTLRYPNGWLFIGILFVPMLLVGIALMMRNPALLKKRLDANEREEEQKALVLLSGMLFVAAFVVAGLNFRFSWMLLPRWAVYGASAVFLAAYWMYAEVLRENAYLSRTVEVQEGQKVIDSGLYGIVRHPMYSATLILFLSTGLVLGSPISFFILLLYIPLIAKRIRREEVLLSRELEGYEEYRSRVKYRLIPRIW
ncbi:MAG: methyltransferase family protein [Christensenellales bacterium]|jgi:protein-S-isoprenylcysteine O-methyltransferase Ste14